MTRVLCFCLDGCTYSVVKAFNQYIPFFRKLQNEGRYGEMETVPPANTTIGWSSFFTGKNPGKTGVFNKTQGDANVQSFQQSRLGVQSKAIWDIAGEEGLKSVVFNLPVSYPALPINGVLVSSFDSKGDAWAYPYGLKEKISEVWTPQETPLSEYSSPQKLFDDLWLSITNETNVVASLLKQTKWDLAVIGFLQLDRISHAYLNNNSPVYQGFVKEIYERVALACYTLWEQFKEDTVCVVVCDHGMRITNAGYFINSYLFEKGLIKLKTEAEYGELMSYGTDQNLKNIDFNQSKAWTSGLGGISVNPDVDKKELIRDWTEYKDPRTGKNVFDKVLPREEIWSGEHLNDMPELLAFPATGYEIHWTQVTKVLMRLNTGYSDHNIKDGFYAVTGLDVQEQPAHILDIAPTILKLLNVKVPEDMDKKPLF